MWHVTRKKDLEPVRWLRRVDPPEFGHRGEAVALEGGEAVAVVQVLRAGASPGVSFTTTAARCGST